MYDVEVMVLLGFNGVGKIMIVEMCEGFVCLDVGSIEVFGLDLIIDNVCLCVCIGVML